MKKEFKWWEVTNLSNILIVKEFEDYFRMLSNDNPGRVSEYIKSNSIPFKDIVRLIGFIDFIIKESKDSANLLSSLRQKGNSTVNQNKSKAVKDRRDKIKNYLNENPNPDLKAFSREGYLIKVLELKDSKGKDLSEKTVRNDLKEI